LQASLRALDVSTVDLWLIHWPPNARSLVSTWEQFIAARDEGLVRAIGVSNFSTDQLDEISTATGVTPAVNQIPWSPWQHSAQRLEEHRERGIVLEGYSPFKRSDMRSPVLAEMAAAHGATPARWCCAGTCSTGSWSFPSRPRRPGSRRTWTSSASPHRRRDDPPRLALPRPWT
jgi:diketogulonate reductase-like aldo/keto reductase